MPSVREIASAIGDRIISPNHFSLQAPFHAGRAAFLAHWTLGELIDSSIVSEAGSNIFICLSDLTFAADRSR